MDTMRMALECCVYPDSVKPNCERCGYSCTKAEWVKIDRKLAIDILAMLKAQEPVIVEERADTDTINCPKCGQQFARVGRDKSIYLGTDEEPNYCMKCGQAVKWE